VLFSFCKADVRWAAVASASGTGLPSAVDGATEVEGALLRWKKTGGKEMGRNVRLVLVELSGGGPVVGDGGLEEEEKERGPEDGGQSSSPGV
jgi:hypothetical protein